MKNFLFTIVLALLFVNVQAQEQKHQLSSHILDISKGMPASGVTIQLARYHETTKSWSIIAEKTTDKNGRITDFLPAENSNLGVYKLIFHTKPYFATKGLESFYPFIEVVFEIKDQNHYHVPITLSAYGYSTYRGN